jgi:cytochrome P450
MKQKEKGSINQNEVIVNGALMMYEPLSRDVGSSAILTRLPRIAGTETTAAFLAGLFNMLCRYPIELAKLTEEIRSNFGSEDELNFEKLASLPYLTACIEEGLRIFPSAPIGFVRTVPKGGDTVDGDFIPEGVSACCVFLPTHLSNA